ncbi:MAG: site-2 protease family protein [Oscillospiraceae bacterium]|nr:site-2 protease family protein [Oscillospiraceae bacterium]
MVLLVAASVLSITVHETCHGLAAYKLGDPTAKNAGRLTLNPLRHIDIMGLVLMAVAKFGWAKPVPIDARYFKDPKKGMALTALAGPVSNVLLAFLALLVRSLLFVLYLRLGESAILIYALDFTAYIAIISAGLAVFNLFPIPPLDGSKVLFAVLPVNAWLKLMRYERYGMLVLAVLLLTGLLDAPLSFLRGGLLSALEFVASLPLRLL